MVQNWEVQFMSVCGNTGNNNLPQKMGKLNIFPPLYNIKLVVTLAVMLAKYCNA